MTTTSTCRIICNYVSICLVNIHIIHQIDFPEQLINNLVNLRVLELGEKPEIRRTEREIGGSASKKRSSRSVRRCSSSRHGYSQECFDYVFDYLPPGCSYLNEPTADSQPLPSAPVLPYVYDDEEEKQIDMPIAISASPEVPNYPRESASTSMNPSYACDVDEEDRLIDMAIWASLKAPYSARESSTSSMNPNYGQECSSRFEICSSSSSSSSSSLQPRENPNHFSGELGGCGICFEVVSMPVICDPCGHVSCYECLLRIQGSTNRCPRCRGAITKVTRIYV